MKRETQRTYWCYRCGRTYEDGEDFWYKSVAETYCIDCDEEDDSDIQLQAHGQQGVR